jgi:hypothetical protein
MAGPEDTSSMSKSCIVNRVYDGEFGLCAGAIQKTAIIYVRANKVVAKSEHYCPVSAPRPSR